MERQQLRRKRGGMRCDDWLGLHPMLQKVGLISRAERRGATRRHVAEGPRGEIRTASATATFRLRRWFGMTSGELYSIRHLFEEGTGISAAASSQEPDLRVSTHPVQATAFPAQMPSQTDPRCPNSAPRYKRHSVSDNSDGSSLQDPNSTSSTYGGLPTYMLIRQPDGALDRVFRGSA